MSERLDVIEIDGSLGEGGGQVIRTSIALATLYGKGVRVTNIRAKRPNPGLQAQHLTGVKAVAALSDAELQDLRPGSPTLTFIPRTRRGGQIQFDIGTAGSITLVLQAMMPASAFAPEPVEIHLVGGTDVKWSPTIDYMRHVVLPNLALAGYEAELQLERRGHYPKGGGRVAMRIRNVGSMKPVELVERGSFSSIEGISHCVKLPSHVATWQAATARERLNGLGYENVNIAVETYPPDRDPHAGPGSGIALFAPTETGCVLGSDSLGERGKPAEKVGDEAAWKLHQELQSKAPFDRHMADIIVPYLAVATGRSKVLVSQLTMHAVTNIQITERVSGVKFQVEGELGTPARISVDGKPP